jgi:hypothetical protein
LGKVRPSDIYKLVNLLKLRKACELDVIPNSMPQASSKKTTGISDAFM